MLSLSVLQKKVNFERRYRLIKMSDQPIFLAFDIFKIKKMDFEEYFELKLESRQQIVSFLIL